MSAEQSADLVHQRRLTSREKLKNVGKWMRTEWQQEHERSILKTRWVINGKANNLFSENFL